jgi:NifU-like protein involved in Fe-S cluster formation
VAELRAAVTAMLKEGAAVPGQPFSDYAAFDGVTGYPNRHTCVLLPIEALLAALDAN